MAILHLKLNDDANGLKHSLVIIKNSFGRRISVAETLIKNLKALDPGIEGFMPSFCSMLELPDGCRVEGITNTNLLRLAFVAFIADNPLVCRDLAFQAIGLAIDCNVILARRKGTINPNKFGTTDGDP